jgi:D-aminoacyl-tRNA deacylase
LIGILFNGEDIASKNIAEYIIAQYGFEERQDNAFLSGDIKVVKSEKDLIYADFVDNLGLEIAYMLSKHVSAAGISSITTHATGNWNGEAKLGGKPYELSVAAPIEMLSILRSAANTRLSELGLQITYEATHHGPLLKTPSLFVEIGGNEQAVGNKEYAALLGDALMKSIDMEKEYGKVVIGIGGTHYPDRFSKLAKEKGFAFAHIMPRYALESGGSNLFMLEQAAERSRLKPEAGLIDWHSFNSTERQKILKKLEDIGLDYISTQNL